MTAACPALGGGTNGMKKRILPAIAIVAALSWMGLRIGVPALAPGSGPGSAVADNPAGIVDGPTNGPVREVTAYNVGVKRQTDDTPCLGATGENLCRIVARGRKVCAANFVPKDTILDIEGYGECVVLDRMNRRFAHRVDIAMSEDEADRALEFGVQRRRVEVKTAHP
jgi:3D (Asp-Asp-Asp) domain-containing protein